MGDETTTVASGEMITAADVKAHERNLAGLRKGLAAMCIAMQRIKENKTFTVEGCNNFTEFCEKRQIGKTQGYQMASAGAVFKLAAAKENSAIPEKIAYLDVMKPISKMAPDSQVSVLELAIEVVAPKFPSKQVVQDVAAQHFNWFPDAKKKGKDTDKPPLLVSSEKLFRGICEIPLHPEEFVEEFGDPLHVKDLVPAYEFLHAVIEEGKKVKKEPPPDG